MGIDSEEHSMVRVENLPSQVHGPLFRLEGIRSHLLNDVARKTQEDFEDSNLEILLGEALYSERIRMNRMRTNVFTRPRMKRDRFLWNQVQSGLVKPPAEVDRKVLMERIIHHYAEEIGGHFDPRVYRFATRAVPWSFSWLLNAASVQRFLPWGMTESLESKVHVLGEVSSIQSLAEKGTILLVPTHQSNIDSVLIGYIIYLLSLPPFAYGAGLNLFSNPFLSFFMSRLGSYTVDRQKRNEIYKNTLKNYSTRILREGIHSIFFPGGGRSRSGAIESKVKLGLLGTGLQAEIAGHRERSAKPRVFVVPMVMSYHFVLEARSLIEDYLAELGKYRYIGIDDESFHPTKVLQFFWKVFSFQSTVTVRLGKPLDVFGNEVDDEGHSIGPNGTVIDPIKWITTRGEICAEPQRDSEYTRELGSRLVSRFHRENCVLTSHLVAFAFFEKLRTKYSEFDLYRFLRLSLPQRSIPYADFLVFAEEIHRRILQLESRGELHISTDLRTTNVEKWVKDGVCHLGIFHDTSVIKIEDGVVWTDDMNLLYYYRNRLTGYGLSRLAGMSIQTPGAKLYDSQGFLA